jgi:hypothetical protein
MTHLMFAFLLVAGIWMMVLSFVIVLLIRQVALLMLRLSTLSGALPLTGPELGEEVPQDIADQIPGRYWAGGVLLLFLSEGCSDCRELAIALRSRRPLMDTVGRSIVFLTGPSSGPLVDLLPPWVRIVRDPLAQTAFRAFRVSGTPFGIATSQARVIAKSHLHTGEEWDELVAKAEALHEPTREPVSPEDLVSVDPTQPGRVT